MLNLRAQVAEARERAQQAQSLTAAVSRRERQQIEAIALFVNGQGQRSYALIREHLADYPRDMLMIRLAQRLFVLGCSGAGVASFPAVLFALMQNVESAYGDDWAFLGPVCLSHTMKQDACRRRADWRSAPWRCPTNAVAAHSQPACSRPATMPTVGTSWTPGSRASTGGRPTILSWHQALFELARAITSGCLPL
jgi:hypothetical protein